ncbi:MAG: cyanoexosortase A system-associated protein [Goleter apudmare HA4340-LM2]|nr:cyanoexosortase A system-associated protein [Goleter apudmare HA4340-LM2]
MIINKKFRVPMLALTFSSAVLVLGKLILFPVSTRPEFTPFVFPDKVPVPQWQLSESRPLPKPTADIPELLSQRYYRYTQNSQQLDIDMHYLALEYTHLDIQKWTKIPSAATIRHHKGIGFYGLGIDQQRAYLSSCINPRGGSTFTYEQFNRNRYIYDLHPQYLLSWLIGQNSLLDRRCLWVNLSLSLNDSTPDTAYRVLENAWFAWYKWWQARFPSF